MKEVIIDVDEKGKVLSVKPTTPNYNLVKPKQEDFYDVEDHNGNMDIIDTELKSQSQQIQNCLQQIEGVKQDVAEIDVTWEGITGKPPTFPPSSHTHDDRYYTESEVNNKLATKSDTTHNHDAVYMKQGSSEIRFQNNDYLGHDDSTNRWYVRSDDTQTKALIYTTANKPTKADVGLGSVPNYPATSSVADASEAKLATAGAVKKAYDRAEQAFQSASSGKKAIATAITAKGVPASGSDTHATLANKVSQIKTRLPLNISVGGIYDVLYQNQLPERYCSNAEVALFDLHFESMKNLLVYKGVFKTTDSGNVGNMWRYSIDIPVVVGKVYIVQLLNGDFSSQDGGCIDNGYTITSTMPKSTMVVYKARKNTLNLKSEAALQYKLWAEE